MNPLIKLKDVSFQYPNADEFVVNNLTTDFHENQFITIIGPNGSGKSTMAKLLNGLLLKTGGSILVDNIEISDADDQIWHIREQVGLVFQNPDNQIVANTVEEDVAFGLENQGVEPESIRQRVNEAIEKVGLTSFKLFEPHHLSGGQKQKVAIAGIIAMKPKVIIFDEATSMLDPKGRKEVLETASLLTEKEGITVIHITHFLQETLFADRVIVMYEGNILLDGKPKQVFKERNMLLDIGLEVPLPVELAFRIKEHGYSLRSDLVTEEEFVEELWRLV